MPLVKIPFLTISHCSLSRKGSCNWIQLHEKHGFTSKNQSLRSALIVREIRKIERINNLFIKSFKSTAHKLYETTISNILMCS